MEAGSWNDHGSTGLSSTSATPWNAIDANWIEINGTQYINFGSYWQNLFQAGEQNGLKVKVGSAHNIAYNSTGPSNEHRMEASFMVEHDGWYYLFFSVGLADHYDTRPPAPGEEYHIDVCRSNSGTGGFVSFIYLFFQLYVGCGRQRNAKYLFSGG
jgi:arabinan endo-1,5-alpha-L-arabinosidase